MNAATFPTITSRFAWKEYRMLRGFWLAVAGLTFLEQWLSTEFAAPGTNLPAWLLGSALFAAVLYAVGAAATSFAVEHEEETYHFLSGLPTSWSGLLVGKLIATTLSAIALAAVLALAGRGLCGEWPLPSKAGQLVGLFGVAILEAVAWGTLFSLLLKRPLVAAVWALLATTIAIHLAVSATDPAYTASLELESYNEAIPLRLAIVSGVLLLCAALARNWLVVSTHRRNVAHTIASFKSILPPIAMPHAGVFASPYQTTATAPPVSRLRMFISLLWQTWRESWKLLFVPWLAACLIFAIIASVLPVISTTTDRNNWITLAPLVIPVFALPALYGALVFHADQRRRQYRFLTEHAATPRWVWFARHCVWGGAFVVVLLVIQLLMPLGIAVIRDSTRGLRNLPPGDYARSFMRVPLLVSAFATVLLGSLLPYAIGQFCSMLVRSGIIAIFLTLVLSLVATGWTFTVWAWRLNGWLFLVPLAVGFLAATWLRAPDWLGERNTWRGWWKPAAAILASFALVCAMLPFARLAQLPERPEALRFFPLDIKDPRSNSQQAATETAEMYFDAAEVMESWREHDPVAPWKESEYAMIYGGMDPETTPPEKMEEYKGALKQQKEMRRKAMDSAKDVAIAASRRHTCRFDFDWGQLQVPAKLIDRYLASPEDWPGLDNRYVELTTLAYALPELAPKPELKVEYYIAALQMSADLREHVPIAIYIDQLRVESHILYLLGRWSQMPERTEAELREANGKLEGFFLAHPLGESDLFVVDRRLIRDAIEGRRWPLALSQSPIDQEAFLAYHANLLPWERERALKALDLVIVQNMSDTYELLRTADSSQRLKPLEFWLRPGYQDEWPSFWQTDQRAAATSYLMRFEFEARMPIYSLFRELLITKTIRNATLVRIALVRYRLAHGRYPSNLSKLQPAFLSEVPIDPYSGRDFEYRPEGLDLPLNYSGENPKGTPLFWSVGPDNASLIMRFMTTELPENGEEPGAPSAGRSTIHREAYYTLQSANGWDNTPALVFPLPK